MVAIAPAIPMPALRRNRWTPRRAPRKDKLARLRAFVQQIAKEQGEQAGVQVIRKLCREDLFYLCVEILGYKDLEEPLHDDLCDFIAYAEREKKTNVILIPRGHFKSTIGTVGRCIQWIIQDQNTAIGLGSSDKTNAEKFLREIRGHLETNQKLKALFSEIFYEDPRRESDKWTQEEILVKRTVAKKEGTIKVFGLEDALPTGDHYPHLLVDDAVNEDNIRTEERIKKINDQAKYLIPLLMTPDQPINWVGTRYHIFDVYQGLIDDENNAVYLRQDIEEGAPIMPKRFTKAILEATRIKLGTYIYNCQYRMEPTDPAMKKFRREWLKWYTIEIHKRHGHVFFMTVDPASRRRKSSDFTAITVWGIDKDWNFYLVDGVHDKLDAGQRIDAVFRLVKKWGIDIVGYETIGFQETDAFFIKQRQISESTYFQIVPISSHDTRKDERIEGLQPIMLAGHFWLPKKSIPYIRLWESPDDGKGKEVDIVQEFLAEFDFYPNAAHDDLLDSAQMARHIVYQGHIPTPPDPVPAGADYSLAALLRGDEEKDHEAFGI